MAEGFVHTVHVAGRWENKVEGQDLPLAGTYETKEEATAAGRSEAKRRHTEHVIHLQDGSIAERTPTAATPRTGPGRTMTRKLLTGEWFIEKTSAHRRRVIHYWVTILWLTVGLVVWIILRDALWFVGFMSLYAIWVTHLGRLGGRDPRRGRGGGGSGSGQCVGKRSRGGGNGGDRADLVSAERSDRRRDAFPRAALPKFSDAVIPLVAPPKSSSSRRVPIQSHRGWSSGRRMT